MFAVTFLTSSLTVLISAWLPARKLSKLTHLQAIQGTGELHLKKKKNSHILNILFGFHTSFERYQDAWDVMVTLKNTEIEDLEQGEDIRNLQGARSSITYQKESAICYIKEENISDDLSELGGLKAVAGDSVTVGEEYYFVKAPIVIMDDKGFDEYCEQIGIESKQGGSVVLNRIWDSVNSNYSLVQFIPLSVWNQISAQIGNAEADTYIRILGEDRVNLNKLNELQSKISQMLQSEYMVEIENRIQEKITDDNMRNGAMLIWGAFCFLLAVIGIANVFSNTLGFIRQRKREFAIYISVGITPKGMRKMFCIEALVIAGRPISCNMISEAFDMSDQIIFFKVFIFSVKVVS